MKIFGLLSYFPIIILLNLVQSFRQVFKLMLWSRPRIRWFSKSGNLIGWDRHLASINFKTLLSMPHANLGPHENFADDVSDPAILHQLTHHHRRVHEKHRTSRISKILKFQMDKILRLHNRHMEQGNMSKSHRADFERKLKIKFNHIKNYSMKKLRKDHEEKKRSRRYKNFLRPRRA